MKNCFTLIRANGKKTYVDRHCKKFVFCLLSTILLCPTNSFASFSVDPTLGTNSIYNLSFEETSKDNARFAVYSYDKKTGAITGINYYTFDSSIAIVKPDQISHEKMEGNLPADIVGSFWGLNKTLENVEYGGAIHNETSVVNSIVGDFVANGYSSQKAGIVGVAIYNNAEIASITGDFIGNNGVSYSGAYGDAVYNYTNGHIGKLKGNFIGNSMISGIRWPNGAALRNKGTIDLIEGNFIANYALGKDFEGNAYSDGGAINNGALISEIKANFIGNEANGGGAVINSKGTINSINGNFIGNIAHNWGGGALVNSGIIGTVVGDFVGNSSADWGGALKNIGSIDRLQGIFSGNFTTYKNLYPKTEILHALQGGAIFNSGTIGKIVNSIFVGNYAQSNSEDQNAHGGAIYSNKDILIAAENGDSIFSDNYMQTGNTVTGNDIYMAGSQEAPIVLNLLAANGSISFNSGIDGSSYTVNIDGKDAGVVNFGAPIQNAEIVGNGAIVNVSSGDFLSQNNSLTVNGGTFNIKTLASSLVLNRLEINGGSINVGLLDIDLAAQTAGRLTAKEYGNAVGSIKVDAFRVTTDGKKETDSVAFVDKPLAENVVLNTSVAQGPVWQYDVSYDRKTGGFAFTRTGKVNPEVSTPVVATAATVAVLSDEIYSRVLGNVALGADDVPFVSSGDRRIKNAWVKTFASEDSVDLKNFAGADSRFYGVIGGFSSDRISEGRGWSAVYGVYGAYAGGRQEFFDERLDNNGGYFGVGANFYRGNFHIGATANLGLMRNRSQKTGTDGKDKFNSYTGGVAAKAGYGFRIGSMMLEPGFYASYTAVSADDYHTASGAEVEFGTMSVIQTAPGLTLYKDFGNGLKAWVGGRYMWTFAEGEHVRADDFNLPDVDLEDYVEYGIGLQKSGDDFSGFAEIKRRDGGREGWNFIAGCKFMF